MFTYVCWVAHILLCMFAYLSLFVAYMAYFANVTKVNISPPKANVIHWMVSFFILFEACGWTLSGYVYTHQSLLLLIITPGFLVNDPDLIQFDQMTRR